MNKKLFSWKALAGLTLLVAMGLTSCQQGNEVDPNDPTGSTKPVQPSVVDNKGADLTFTIKKAADLNTLWASYDAAKKTELMKKTTLNIAITLSDFEIEATPITLPKFMNTVTNSLLNVTFSGNFKNADKQMFGLDLATNYAGAKVNVTLPAAAFDMNLNSAGTAATITSDGATIGKFFTNADANKNNALTIGSGVTINSIDDTATGAILLGGGAINALIVNTNPTLVNKKGFQIGNQGIYTNNLIINGANITLGGNNDTPLGDIIINKGCKLSFNGNSAVNSVIGATKASECAVELNNWQAINKISSVKNVTVTNNGSGIYVTKDDFAGVTFGESVTLAEGMTSFSNVELTSSIWWDFTADNQTFTFSNVKFATGTNLLVWGGIYVSTTPTKTTYQWDIDNKVWVEVTGAAPISAANASDAGVEVSSNDVYYNTTTSQLGAYDGNLGGKIGDHKVVTIVNGTGTYVLPENCTLILDSKCSIAGAAIIDNNINTLINNTANDPTYLTVQAGSDTYTYRKTNWGYTLVKK